MPLPFEDLLAHAIELRERGDDAEFALLLQQHPEHRARLDTALDRLQQADWLRTSNPPDLPERLGDFRLLQRLGGGGMGVVFLAEQTSLGRKVAVKVVRPELLASDVVRERFQRETETIARLQHPGIVQVIAVGREGPFQYYAMEYLTGCSLSDVLAALGERRPQDLTRNDFDVATGLLARDTTPNQGSWWEVVTTCFAEVAETVAFVHGHGVIHRDLKPSNLVVTAQGRTKLLDFGLVHIAADPRLTRSGSEVGSPAYMSPEQLRGQSVDERSDVYSLALALRQLLTLALPFATDNDAVLRTGIAAGPAPAHWWRTANCPRDLQTVVDQAMDIDRERRHATMAAFAADLRAVLLARPITARSPSLVARCERWRRRHPVQAGAATVLGLLILLAPVPLWWWQRGQSERLDQALATAQSDLGEAEAAIVRMLANAAALDLTRVPEAVPVRLQLMQDAVDFYQRMIARHPSQGRLLAAQAECCFRFGLELRVVGRRAEASAMFDRSEVLHTDAAMPAQPAIAVQRLLALKVRALIDREAGDIAGSERRLDHMQDLANELRRRWPDNFDGRLQAAEILNERSHLRYAAGRFAEQVLLLQQALEEKRAIARDFPQELASSESLRQSLAMQCINLADARRTANEEPKATRALYAEADQLLTVAPPEDSRHFWDSLRGETWCCLGAMDRQLGDLTSAALLLQRAIEHQRQLLRITPVHTNRLRVLATACFELAGLLLTEQRFDAATESLAEGSRAIKTLTEGVAADSFTQALVVMQANTTRDLQQARAAAGR